MNDKILKIDKIDLKFKDWEGRIQTIAEFSTHFERGVLFLEHPATKNGSTVIIDIDSNYGCNIFHFKFHRMDIELGYHLIDELVRKWSLIWTWYNQTHFDSNKKLRKYSSMFGLIKNWFGEDSKEYESILNSLPEEI